MKLRSLGILGFLAISTPLLLSSCGGDDPAIPTTITVTPADQSFATVGETQQFSARVDDQNGNVIADAVVTWSSSRPAVATVSAMGLATAVTQGTATIRATADGASGTGEVTVDFVPAALEKVAGDGQSAGVLNPLPESPTVEVRDAGGSPISGERVEFSVVSGGGSVSPSSATTGADGRASTLWTLGNEVADLQRIRATAGSVSTEFTAQAEPGILAVATPALDDGRETLVYSESLLATGGTGTGYSWSLADGSLPPGVALATDGSLDGTPTAQGTYQFTVRVEDSAGDEAERPLSLRICEPPIQLAPGGSIARPAPIASQCALFLPSGEGARYRVALLRPTSATDGSAGGLTAATLSVQGFGTTPFTIPSPPPADLLTATRLRGFQDAIRIAEATEATHLRLREAEARLMRSLGPDAAVLPPTPYGPGASGVVRAADAALVDPPDRLLLDPTTECGSTGSTRVAKLIAFNDDIAIYQDSVQQTTAPVEPAYAVMMLDYYRDFGKPVITDYFGPPADVNGDGRITVFVTPAVQDQTAAFVWSGDFLAKSQCFGSNEQEMVYFNADVIAGIADDNFQALPVLVHEVKHVSSLYKRQRSIINGGGSFHPPWIEEGRAEIAAEMSSRVAWATVDGPAVGAMASKDDKDRTGVLKENYGVLLRLARVIISYSGTVNSVTSNPEPSTPPHTFYGTSWHFHRFIGDVYGSAATPLADAALFKSLADSLTTSGIAGLQEVTGRPYVELLEELAIAMMANGIAVPEKPFTSYQFPSLTTELLVNQPEGTYPWPVTAGPDAQPVPFGTASYTGQIGHAGIRIHDFLSNGSGSGIDLRASSSGSLRLLIVRLQ